MIELHPVMAVPWPAKLHLLQPLRVEANLWSVRTDEFDAVGPFTPEGITGATEHITAGIAYRRQQAV